MANMNLSTQRITLFQLPLDIVTQEAALDLMGTWLYEQTPRTVVTLNPEFVMQTRTDHEFAHTIQCADLVTADGVGIVYAVRRLQNIEVPRAPGFDLATGLMQRHGKNLRVFFLGAKPGVAEQAAHHAYEQYGITVAGSHHGYFSKEEDEQIAQLIRETKPHLLLTGMGAGRQEQFNKNWAAVHGVPVSIGCGGVLDVLAGTATLAPDWTRKIGIEFVWRIATDRSRWHRAPKLLQFVALVESEKRKQKS